jgi:hypothetical protein
MVLSFSYLMSPFTSCDIFAITQTNCFDAKITSKEGVLSKDVKATVL